MTLDNFYNNPILPPHSALLPQAPFILNTMVISPLLKHIKQNTLVWKETGFTTIYLHVHTTNKGTNEWMDEWMNEWIWLMNLWIASAQSSFTAGEYKAPIAETDDNDDDDDEEEEDANNKDNKDVVDDKEEKEEEDEDDDYDDYDKDEDNKDGGDGGWEKVRLE